MSVASEVGWARDPRAAWSGLAAAARRSGHLVVLLAVGVPLLFTALGLEFLDPDEGLYADIARTMLVSGDWVLPRFNGLPYLEKPPLLFWLAAPAMTLVSGEVALRGWSAIAALGTVLLTWRIGRHLYGPHAGVLAGLMLATMAGSALYVRKASTDFLFVFCLTLALWGFLKDVDRPGSPARFLLGYAGIALGMLAKGLIGVVFPLAILALTLAWVRALRPRELNLGRGALVFGALVLPWHLLVALRDPALFGFYLIDNQVLRFLNLRGFIEDDVPVSTLGFLAVTFVWLFPWSVFALARPATPAAAEGRWRPLAVVWALVVVGFFAVSRSKLEYYALPAFPAVALIAGAAWASGRDVGRWLVVALAGSTAAGAGAVWIGLHLTPAQALFGLGELNVYYRILRDQALPFPFESAGPFGQLLVALGAALIAGWASAAALWFTGRRRAACGALLALGAVIAGLVVALLHVVEPHHSAKAVAQAITGRAAPDDVVAHEGSLEYSAALPYYTARRIVVVNGERGDLDWASRRPEARGYFLDTDGLTRMWTGSRRVFLVTQHRPPRSVTAQLPAGTVHALGKFGSRWLYSNRGS
ncbi:MAG: glycosyltransferase family 39 protein [Candidatus Rokubacteria bacterium]|nr:glycosyltransferase family 39 protein [Candidatus Rokubacteria bacterium]